MRCPNCGEWHTLACPLVKSVEYRPDATESRIEFHDGLVVLPLPARRDRKPADRPPLAVFRGQGE